MKEIIIYGKVPFLYRDMEKELRELLDRNKDLYPSYFLSEGFLSVENFDEKWKTEPFIIEFSKTYLHKRVVSYGSERDRKRLNLIVEVLNILKKYSKPMNYRLLPSEVYASGLEFYERKL